MTLILLFGFLTHAPYCDVLHYDCQDYSNDSNPTSYGPFYLGPYYDTTQPEGDEDNEEDKEEIDLEESEYLAKISSNEKDKRQTLLHNGYFQSGSV